MLKISLEQDENVIHQNAVVSRHHLLMLFVPIDGLLDISHPSSPCHLTAPATFRQHAVPSAYSVLHPCTVRTGISSCSHSHVTQFAHHRRPSLSCVRITNINSTVLFRFPVHIPHPSHQTFPAKKLIVVLIHTSLETFFPCCPFYNFSNCLWNKTSSGYAVHPEDNPNMKHTRHILTSQCCVPTKQTLLN
jgi:hypothetical protein